MGNITRVVPVDLITDGDYEDESEGSGFFVRVETEGVLQYLPMGNEDNEPITKTWAASNIFIDPERIRKIINLGVVSPAQAEGIVVGYGV
jgi:hypothetical protein